MIKTPQQLRATKEQADALETGLAGAPTSQEGVHPVIFEAGRNALREQIADLRADINEYERLRDGADPSPDLTAIADLATNLIKARIAKGMSQTDLARQLGVAVQQVQRYESNDYAGASLTRLREIAEVLGQRNGRGAPTGVVDAPGLSRRLASLGLPHGLALRLAGADTSRPGSFSQHATAAALALGVDVDALVDETEPVLAVSRPGFKLASRSATRPLPAYTAYAESLSSIVAASARVVGHTTRLNPDDIRSGLLERDGAVTFAGLLDFCWDAAVPVLPLTDPGAFHAACFTFGDQHVIVLKQLNRSPSRWAYDLAHELCHVADRRSGREPSEGPLIDDDTVDGWTEDPQEQRANRFAARIVLGVDAEDLAQRVSKLADGRVDRLREAVRKVAADAAVDRGALANYVAVLATKEGVNWWGAATNLQTDEPDPWRTTRDRMLVGTDFARLAPPALELLVQALA